MTQISETSLKEVLLLLSKCKIITYIDNQVELNQQFKSNNRKITLYLMTHKDNNANDDKITYQKVNEDRRFAIQAAIVRVMKQRRDLGHQSLLVECVNQLNGKFVPTIPDIKKNIDILVEKEYLTRNDDKSYTYIA